MDAINLLGAQVGTGIAGEAAKEVGWGLGEITGYNQAQANRQLEQQSKLNMQQQQLNWQTMDKQQQLQKDMINFTDATHQVQRIKDAGLSVGLMYGGSGAGGQTTTGNASAIGVNGGNASNESDRNAAAMQSVAMGLQLSKLQSEIEVNKSVANANNASAELSGAKTTTENNQRDIAIENLRQSGISQWLENEITQYKIVPEDQGSVRNAVLKVYTSVSKDSMQIQELNNVILKTAADTGNANAQALLTNEKAKGYAQELINATLEADNDRIKAVAMKLSAEWETGEYTNWRTWVELGQNLVNTATNVVNSVTKLPQMQKNTITTKREGFNEKGWYKGTETTIKSR